MYLFILDGSTLAVAHIPIIIICDCNRFTPMTHHRECFTSKKAENSSKTSKCFFFNTT